MQTVRASAVFCLLLAASCDRGDSVVRQDRADALAQVCVEVISASGADVLPDDADPGNGNGNGNGNASVQLLSQLADPDPGSQSQAALRILRKAPDHGDPALIAATRVVGDLADWRADPALVKILRDRFPSSSRRFTPMVRANAALALGAITENARGTPPSSGNEGSHGASPVPDYLFRAVAASVCPTEPLEVRQAGARALGQIRDGRAEEILRALRDAPSTGDDVQDRLLSFTASRSLTMLLPENFVTEDVAADTSRALRALEVGVMNAGGGVQ